MKKPFLAIFLISIFVGLVAAQEDELSWGTTAWCEDGGSINDGVEVMIVNLRAGNTYTITAIGIDGFDPALAVAYSTNLESSLCNDDSDVAADYRAWLPTTGEVEESSLSSQVVFNLNNIDTDFVNMSFVVTSVNGEAGEFVLIVEDMYAAPSDGAGDPFSLYLSHALLASEVTPTAYMISVTSGLDSMVYLISSEYEYRYDEDGNWIGCDNAGFEGCWGDSSDMTDFYVSRTEGRFATGWNYDAMLSVPFTEESLGFYQNYTMAGNASEGDYVAAFHLGWAGSYPESE
jgi:hypothetical protein